MTLGAMNSSGLKKGPGIYPAYNTFHWHLAFAYVSSAHGYCPVTDGAIGLSIGSTVSDTIVRSCSWLWSSWKLLIGVLHYITTSG